MYSNYPCFFRHHISVSQFVTSANILFPFHYHCLSLQIFLSVCLSVCLSVWLYRRFLAYIRVQFSAHCIVSVRAVGMYWACWLHVLWACIGHVDCCAMGMLTVVLWACIGHVDCCAVGMLTVVLWACWLHVLWACIGHVDCCAVGMLTVVLLSSQTAEIVYIYYYCYWIAFKQTLHLLSLKCVVSSLYVCRSVGRWHFVFVLVL